MKLDASDIIAIAAAFFAIVLTVIQIISERKREWHYTCETLIKSLLSVYEEIRLIIERPHETNLISFQFCLRQRYILLEHFQKRFILKKQQIKSAKKIIANQLMELPINYKYEEVILFGEKTELKYHFEFLNKIKTFTVQSVERLIK